MNAQLSLLPDVTPRKPPLRETAAWRVAYGAETPALADLLAVLIGGNQSDAVAGRLLARFGQASEIDAAPVEELANIPGITRATAARLKAALALGRRLLDPPEERVTIGSPGDAARLIQALKVQRQPRLARQTEQLALGHHQRRRAALVVGERLAQVLQGAAQHCAGLAGLALRPQHGGQFVARVRPRLHRQVGQQGQRLAGAKRDRAAPPAHLRPPQQEDGQLGHLPTLAPTLLPTHHGYCVIR